MDKSPGKPRTEVGKFLDNGREEILRMVKRNPNIINQFLGDATDADLWRMVDIFRGTIYWDKFLRALLSISQDVWMEHKLVVSKAFKRFEGNEIEEVIGIYQDMGTDFKARQILFNLDYDKYWTHRVHKTAKMDKQKAEFELKLACHDLPHLPGIPTRASEKCLVELDTYVKSLQETE